MNILLAEDEEDMSRAIATVLRFNKYDVTEVHDGEAAVKAAGNDAFDCMIFDIMMPKMSGLEALQAVRASGDNTPVIFLTAKSEVDDRITGLDAGADDYLTKPFAMKELLARIRSMTRRNTSYNPTKLELGSTTLDMDEQELSCQNSIRLARKEALLMEYLILNSGKTLSRDEIFMHVWKDEPESDVSIVWVYISYLKSKLEAIASDIEISGDTETGFTADIRG